jgi:hypothetical protein
VDSNGLTEQAATLTTQDSKVKIDIAQGTRLQTALGFPLLSLQIVSIDPPAPPAEHSVIMAFDFSPEGATFSPALNVAFTYDPAVFPGNVSESDLYVAWWDGAKWWQKTDTEIDTKTHVISFQLEHFSEYALLGKITPATTTSAIPSPSPITTVKNTVPSSTTPITPVVTPNAVGPPGTSAITPNSQPSQDSGMSPGILITLVAVFIITVTVTTLIVLRSQRSST